MKTNITKLELGNQVMYAKLIGIFEGVYSNGTDELRDYVDYYLGIDGKYYRLSSYEGISIVTLSKQFLEELHDDRTWMLRSSKKRGRHSRSNNKNRYRDVELRKELDWISEEIWQNAQDDWIYELYQ